MTQLDKNITLMCAMRYALGSKTYVVSSVTNELIENWNNFKKGSQQQILTEIREAIENKRAGMNCDVNNWTNVILNAEFRKVLDLEGDNNGN